MMKINRLTVVLFGLLFTIFSCSHKEAKFDDLEKRSFQYFDASGPFTGTARDYRDDGSLDSKLEIEDGFIVFIESYGFKNDVLIECKFEEIITKIEGFQRVEFITTNELPDGIYYDINVVVSDSNSNLDVKSKEMNDFLMRDGAFSQKEIRIQYYNLEEELLLEQTFLGNR